MVRPRPPVGDRNDAEQQMPRAGTKQALLHSMLSQDQGASIQEIAYATGWKDGSVHSALSTMRAKGWLIHNSEKSGKIRYKLSR